jgi:putative transposase
LRQAEEGTPVAEVCRKVGISEASFYAWRKKYGGLMPSEMKRLKQLEEENQRLKKLETSNNRASLRKEPVIGCAVTGLVRAIGVPECGRLG